MTKKRINLTLDERALIDIHIAQGRTLKSIAKILGRAYATILMEVRKRSVNGVYNANVAHDAHLLSLQKIGGHNKKTFSTEDCEYIIEKIKSGYPVTYIALEFGVSRDTIHNEFSQYKRQEPLQRPHVNLFEEVEGIKEQIQILFDTIKELRDAQKSR